MSRLARLGLSGLLALTTLIPHAAWAQATQQAPPAGPSPQRSPPLFVPFDAATLKTIDTLRHRLTGCWDVPPAVRKAPSMNIIVRIKLERDGSLAEPPAVVNSSRDPLFAVASKSAIAAVKKCAPFGFLPVAAYEVWKEIEIDFDSRDLLKDKPR